MPRYHVRYLKGPNMHLHLHFEDIEEAPSFEAVLRRHTDWPIHVAWDDKAATAWNPTGCIYFQEMWEAALLKDDAHMPLIGAWKQGESEDSKSSNA